ncbi:hypothetical protein Zmor_012401 [Zophobas morio]|jgi:hypothetical protein|uniref:Uncharacterized protein n=1 Tax=Zophobas morio TaxID=2755281 RepID=A0AA38HEZ7_9CUCU|nr:hypothetical protein Zmor_012401 [Zophobas morio]
MYRPALIHQRRRLIPVAMLAQSADFYKSNQLHRYIRKKLMTHFNNKWEAKQHHITELGKAVAPFLGILLKRSKSESCTIPLPSEGNISTENDEDLAHFSTLFANLPAAQNVPPAHLTSNDALPQLS